MYYHLYKPETVNTTKKCECGHCDVYPELFHAEQYEIVPYREIKTLSQANSLLKRFPDAVIIEFPNEIGEKQNSYRNIKTGKTWRYNGHTWKQLNN